MLVEIKRSAVAVFAALAVLALAAAPAFAGECPADRIGVDVTPPGPSAPSGLTDAVIASIDLQSYGIPGRQLRMRRIVVAPGGVVPWHAHATRPGETYVLEGRITEYRSTCADPIEHGEGDAVVEQGPASHWWRNNSRRDAILLSADILPPSTN